MIIETVLSVEGTAAMRYNINMSKRPLEGKIKLLWVTATVAYINAFVWLGQCRQEELTKHCEM